MSRRERYVQRMLRQRGASVVTCLVAATLGASYAVSCGPGTVFGPAEVDVDLDDAAYGSTVLAVEADQGLRDDALMIVAHPRRSDGGRARCGRIAAYVRGSTRPKWVLHGDAADVRLGRSLTFCGDLDGDARADVLVGAPGGGRNGDGPGAVWCVSSRDGRVIWKLAGTVARQGFGFSTAYATDFDGDGVRDAVVGAPSCMPACAATAYVVSLAQHAVVRSLRPPPDPAVACRSFGTAVAAFTTPGADGTAATTEFAISDTVAETVFVVTGSKFALDSSFSTDVGWYDFGATLLPYTAPALDSDVERPVLCVARRRSIPDIQVSLCTRAGDVVTALSDVAMLPNPRPFEFSGVCVLEDLDGDLWPELALAYCGEWIPPWSESKRNRSTHGRVVIHSGKTGAVIRFFDAPADAGEFATGVATVPDADGDGFDDLVVGLGERARTAARIYSSVRGVSLAEFSW